MKINAWKFALAGGIYCCVMAMLVTAFALAKIPGYLEFANALTKLYGFYGYSVTPLGILVGGFWAFVEGSFHLGVFAWLYNTLRP